MTRLSGSSMRVGVYVHLPFCRVHCAYCAFAVSTRRSLESSYLSALGQEIRLRAESGMKASTIYFGGGTPSLISIEPVAELVATLSSALPPEEGAEVTLEANPEDIDEERLVAWSELGINRLSLGVQSFHDSELGPLGRAHGRDGALRALRLLRGSGFRRNIDLIIGLPNQTRASFLESLEIALSEDPEHLSIYMLDLEEMSALQRRVRQGLMELPDEDAMAEVWRETDERCRAAGLEHYELSNWARPGDQSRHNLTYWRRQPYLGLGLGAHSFLRGHRLANVRRIGDYIERLSAGSDAVESIEPIGPREEVRERLLLGLRQGPGLSVPEFVELTGKEGKEWRARGLQEGWLIEDERRVAFTARGFLFSSELIAQLF